MVAFKQLDKDNDGYINLNEFTDGLKIKFWHIKFI